MVRPARFELAAPALGGRCSIHLSYGRGNVPLYISLEMSRSPFVWEVHVRRELVEDEIARLREVPYAIWRDAIGVTREKTMTGRDGREYVVTVTADWARRGAEDIRIAVTLSIIAARVRRALLEQDFVVGPDSQER